MRKCTFRLFDKRLQSLRGSPKRDGDILLLFDGDMTALDDGEFVSEDGSFVRFVGLMISAKDFLGLKTVYSVKMSITV